MKITQKCVLSVGGGLVAGILLTLAYQKWVKPRMSGYASLSFQK